jgi:hypothetical protein
MRCIRDVREGIAIAADGRYAAGFKTIYWLTSFLRIIFLRPPL